MFTIAERLKLSLKSIHLAIYFLDYCISKDLSFLKNLDLFVATSLLLAAKAIEKDDRIPFIN